MNDLDNRYYIFSGYLKKLSGKRSNKLYDKYHESDETTIASKRGKASILIAIITVCIIVIGALVALIIDLINDWLAALFTPILVEFLFCI
jgi:hypothetical protein